MLDSRIQLEKKFNKETHRVIGQIQLQNYKLFLDGCRDKITQLESGLKSPFLSNTKLNPISVSIICKENVSLINLVNSDNKLLSRILFSLGSVCQEAKFLTLQAKEDFFPALINHANNNGKDKGVETVRHFGELLELLQKVQLFIARTNIVINLIVQQKCAILGKKFNLDAHSTLFPEILDSLADLLVCLVTLDSLCTCLAIKEQWKNYRRAVRSISHNPAQFNFESVDVHALDAKLLELEDDLLTGNITQKALKDCLKSNLAEIKSCNLSNEIFIYIQQLLCDIEAEDESIRFMEIWLQSNTMFVLHSYLNESCDKRLLKRLMEVNKKVSACTLQGNILWYPEQFLLKHIPNVSKFIDVKSIAANRTAQVNNRIQNLHSDLGRLCMQACLWFANVEKIRRCDITKITSKSLQEICALLIRGVKTVKKISEFLKWITNLHADEGRPIAKSVVLAIGTLVEVLIAFRLVFQRNVLPISYVSMLITQQLTYKIVALINSLKKQYTKDKTYRNKQIDVLSSLVLAERSLKGPNTPDRIMIAKLALSGSGLDIDALKEIRTVMNKLELICNVRQLIEKLTNCSFLYWHQILFPVYFNNMVNSGTDLARAYLLVAALSDFTHLGECMHEKATKYIDESLIMPLRESIEEMLRYQTHLHLQLPTFNIFRGLPQSCKKLAPLLLSDTYINVKHEVEHYLSTMFYNLTTVVLHDWRTYGEMRQLASMQHGLKTVEDDLPVQTLEQGLDVLEIMRNINVFVSKYKYNLNNQLFIEEWSSDKHLNTINISHVANSIRTHGIGIMSTTVNFTYQFLQDKFYTFSQFMFDEQIKSRLLKDLRHFSENRNELNQLYPYSSAEAFQYGIRKLGLNEKGLSYLDLFRQLITQIGNAMGYVRLIRSGGKKCIADATCFLPSLKSTESLGVLLDNQENLSLLTKQAADFLKRDIKTLEENFEEATEYFKLLINAFSAVFKDPANLHLRNFYIIVPPLTINFVEYMLNSKERLNKNNLEGCAFTDDGFAIGLAFIIAVLDQGSQFNSLHWFQSVRNKLDLEKTQLERKKLEAYRESSLQQTLTLTEKRNKSVETEFTLLHYNFSSARIFFEL